MFRASRAVVSGIIGLGLCIVGERQSRAVEMETKVLLHEDYEKYTPGTVPKGVVGTDVEKGAVIQVVSRQDDEKGKALMFVDMPGMSKTYYPFRELRFAGRKRVDRGMVTFTFDVCNSAEFPSRFDVEMRDWTTGTYRNLPKLEFFADGSIKANGQLIPFRLIPGEWASVSLNFAAGKEIEEKTYKLQLRAGTREMAAFEGHYNTGADSLTWLGFVPYNEQKAVCYIDNVHLAVEREKEEMTPHELFTDYQARGSLARSFARFTAGGDVRVAFMGGSVTTRQWREPVMEYLEDRFPQANFDFIMAGIGGTGADLGAFRLPEHVFGRGRVDLFFLEFAVNGGGVRAMEGIVRQARRLDPDIDIVMMYFASTGHTKTFEAGEIPGIVQEHEKVAEHYNIPALFLYREIARRIQDGKITWADFANDGVHPHQGGCDMYAQCITDFLAKELAATAVAAPRPPVEPLDSLCYERGRFISLEAATVVKGFERIPAWTCEKTCNFSPPVDVLACTEAGSELRLDFEGTAVGIYSIIGMDAGIIEYSIDGAPFREADQFDHYCPKFHRPQHKIFATDLPPGKHSIVLRSGAGHNEQSEGNAIRILKFMVN